MQNCNGCLALTVSNPYGPGFCPIGHEVIKDDTHTKWPKGDCRRPRTHADMIAIQQESDEDEPVD